NQSDNSAPLAGAAYIFTSEDFRPSLALMPDAGGSYTLECHGVPGLTYRLQRAHNVTGPSWDIIDTGTAPVSGLIEFRDAAPPSGQSFYRAVQP
ncbi:MAG TPA: hypothetical protein VN887_11835, partial [Candidatus Angelobacter sp.]|nr:hypothetical protein [Candidatus Angelobacter sp.]